MCVLIGQRDRDLELAARIGQSLLQRNHLLQERNEAVEEQLTQALDQVADPALFPISFNYSHNKERAFV